LTLTLPLTLPLTQHGNAGAELTECLASRWAGGHATVDTAEGGRLPASDRSDATFAWSAQFFGGPLLIK
jgi:hypothetical protein